MFDEVECSRPAYERLQKAGIVEKIQEQKRELRDLSIYTDINSEQGKELLKRAQETFFNSDRRISERSESARDILELDAELNKPREDFGFRVERFRNLLLEHPSFIARLFLGERVFDFRYIGFPTRRSLEEAVASFCIGGLDSWALDDSYAWVTGDSKNRISLNMHGDLYADQIDISGHEERIQTLFGEEVVFDTVKKEPEKRAVHSYQDWSPFLVATLRYAEAIGKGRIPEIVNWKKVLEEVGAVGTATAEAEFGGSGWEMGGGYLMGLPILDESKELKMWPITMSYKNDVHYLPLVKDRKLVYLRKLEDGEIELPNRGSLSNRKYSRCVTYCEDDLPHILRATYRFFARDRALLPKIMDSFLNEGQNTNY